MTKLTKLPKAWQPPKWRAIKADDPKALVKLAEVGIALRRERKALEEKCRVLKKEEDEVADKVINSFDKSALTLVKTKAGSMRLDRKDVPRISDPDALHAHILKTGEWDLLWSRPGEKACQLRWGDGKEVPGVVKDHVAKIVFGE